MTTYHTNDFTVNIYQGENPITGTLLSTQTVTPATTSGMMEVTLDNPLTIDFTQNLWITLTTTGTYVKTACSIAEPNDRWVLSNGEWVDVATLNEDLVGYGWMIRGYVEDLDANAFTWTSETGIVPPYTIENLSPETTYIVKVKASCGTDWKWAQFTTVSPSDKPFDLATTEISATKATLSWTGYQDSYNLQYREVPGLTDFDDSSMSGWTTIDADGDGYTWVLGSECGGIYLNEGGSLAGSGHNASQDLVTSGSYSNVTGVGALTPDNYLVSPKVTLGGSISFWAQAQDAKYPAEHFGVAVSTTGNTDAADFTTIQEWDMTAKAAGANAKAGTTRSGNRAQGTWYKFTVDLSTYSGQGYVAIRHFDCTDQFMLNIDDIVITQPGDDPWTIVNDINVTSYELTGLTPQSNYEWQVQGIFDDEAKGTTEWVDGPYFTTQVLNTIALADDDSDAAEKNSEIIAAYDGKACDVTLTGRTLYKDGLWNTICLPFDVTIEDSPLAGATAKTLSSASTSTSALYGTHIDLAFGEAVSTLEAGKPYIIKWDAAENIVAPVFEDVLIKAESDRTISMDNGNVKFIGYYDAMPITPADDNIFYMKAGKDEEGNDITKLVRTANNRTLRTCRAYFKFSEEAAKLMFALNGDDEATGIVDLDREATTNSGWYTVDGKKLDKQPTRKGVYIQNGRAVVIK